MREPVNTEVAKRLLEEHQVIHEHLTESLNSIRDSRELLQAMVDSNRSYLDESRRLLQRLYRTRDSMQRINIEIAHAGELIGLENVRAISRTVQKDQDQAA